VVTYKTKEDSAPAPGEITKAVFKQNIRRGSSARARGEEKFLSTFFKDFSVNLNRGGLRGGKNPMGKGSDKGCKTPKKSQPDRKGEKGLFRVRKKRSFPRNKIGPQRETQ